MYTDESTSPSKTLLSIHEQDDPVQGSQSRADDLVPEIHDGEFAMYLDREVQIANFSWPVGSAFYQQFNPLIGLVANDFLRARLKTFAYLRFDAIKLRFVVNSSPQKSGILMGTFTPLNSNTTIAGRPKPATNTTPDSYGNLYQENPYFSGGVSQVEQGVSITGCATSDFGYIMQRSTRSPVFINITSDTGSTHVLPWRHWRDALVMDTTWPTESGGVWAGSASFLDAFMDFGYYTLESLGIPLRDGSGGSQAVTVLVYAAFVNPRAYGPTYNTQSAFDSEIQQSVVPGGLVLVDDDENFDADREAQFVAQGGGVASGSSPPVESTSHESGEAAPKKPAPSVDERLRAIKPSQVASAIAGVAGALSKIPVLSFWATATSVVATGAAGILRLFGWSNPPIISGKLTHSLYTNCFSINPQVSRQDDVFALDPRNEVTVDPTLTGGPAGVDELCVDYLCSRKAILDVFTYQQGDSNNQLLFSIPVTPNHSRLTWIDNSSVNNGVNCTRVQMMPYTYFAQLFRYWRGTFCIEVTPVINCFTKGSIQVWWDPMGKTQSFYDGTTRRVIHDIAQGPLVFKVPYIAPQGYLRTDNSPLTRLTASQVNAVSYWGNRAYAVPIYQDNTKGYMNGVVNISVLNSLQGSTDVSFVVRTWFEGMEFAVPSATDDQNNSGTTSVSFANFVPQSAMGVSESVLVSENTSKLSLLYSGEKVPSLRVLLNRSQLWRVQQFLPVSNSGGQFYTFPRFPAPSGCVYWGANLALNTPIGASDVYGPNVTPNTGTFSGNASFTTDLAYVAACFVGHRGSILWRTTPIETADFQGSYFLTRADTTEGGYHFGANLIAIGNSAVSVYRCIMGALGSGHGGMQLSNRIDRVLAGLFPSYLNVRMNGGGMINYMRSLNLSSGGDIHRLGYEAVRVGRVGALAQTTFFPLTVSAGPDWNPLEFLSVPDVFVAGVPFPTT